MTWNRIYQTGAEQRVITDLDHQGTNQVSISSTQAKTETYSYSVGSANALWGFSVPTPKAINRVGYWLRHSGFTNALGYLYMAAGGKTQYESLNIGIRIDWANTNLQVVRPVSGTSNTYEVLATVAMGAVLTTELTWIHIGIHHYLHDTAGILRLYVNGVLLLDYSGDTRMYGQGSGVPAFGTTPAYLWICGSWQGAGSWIDTPSYVDDLWADNSDDEAAAPIPAKIFKVRKTPAAGANAEWTPDSGSNHEMVDDVPNDGDTTKNKALAADLKDTFNFESVTIPADHRIIAEIPTAWVKNLDAGPLLRFHAYDGSSYAHSADLTPALDYAPLFARFTAQPDTTDWNETDANAMQFGYESRGSFA